MSEVESLKKEIDSLKEELKEALDRIKELGKNDNCDLSDELESAMSKLKDKGEEIGKSIQKEPLKGAAITFGIGLIVGWLLKR